MHYEPCFMLTLITNNLLFYWIKHGSNRKSSRKHPPVALPLTKSATVYAFENTVMTMLCIWTPKLIHGSSWSYCNRFVFINFINNFSFQLTSAFPQCFRRKTDCLKKEKNYKQEIDR